MPVILLKNLKRMAEKVTGWSSPHVQNDGFTVGEHNRVARTMREHRSGERRHIGDRAARRDRLRLHPQS
jgi:hypothetical protein